MKAMSIDTGSRNKAYYKPGVFIVNVFAVKTTKRNTKEKN